MCSRKSMNFHPDATLGRSIARMMTKWVGETVMAPFPSALETERVDKMGCTPTKRTLLG